MARINLGDKARDVVTGFVGTVTGKASYLTGCDQYVLTPPAKDGELKDAGWFDENRIEVLAPDTVTLTKAKKDKKGGPAPKVRAKMQPPTR